MMKMPPIEARTEGPRGCGYRKPGGLYLVLDGVGAACGRLPIPMAACPCCSAGIKPARGWTWVDPRPFLAAHPCGADPLQFPGLTKCAACPLGRAELLPPRVGLLWVGGEFYATPDAFLREAMERGISRRIARVPQGFVIGQTWVWLGHRDAIAAGFAEDGTPEHTPGVFSIFKPSRIEYVVRAEDTPEELARLHARGFTLVRVVRAGETGQLFGKDGDDE